LLSRDRRVAAAGSEHRRVGRALRDGDVVRRRPTGRVERDIIAVTPPPMATAAIMICTVRAACGRDSLSASLDVIISRKKKMTRNRITPPAPATSPTTLRVVASMGRACARQPTDRQDTTTWHTPTRMSREGRRRLNSMS